MVGPLTQIYSYCCMHLPFKSYREKEGCKPKVPPYWFVCSPFPVFFISSSSFQSLSSVLSFQPEALLLYSYMSYPLLFLLSYKLHLYTLYAFQHKFIIIMYILSHRRKKLQKTVLPKKKFLPFPVPLTPVDLSYSLVTFPFT